MRLTKTNDKILFLSTLRNVVKIGQVLLDPSFQEHFFHNFVDSSFLSILIQKEKLFIDYESLMNILILIQIFIESLKNGFQKKIKN